jgi:hypothetical protein
MRCTFFCALALAACSASSRPAPRDGSEVHLDPEDYSEGECGGFASLGESEPIALLAGRLFVRGPAGAADSPRPYDIMSAPPTADLESRIFLEHEGARLVIYAEEILREPTDDLVRAVRETVGEDFTVAPLEVDAPLRAAIAVPRDLDLEDEAVDVAFAYTVTEDNLVQRVGFYVTPDAAQDGGCERLALRLARSLAIGGRRLPDDPGPRVLEGSLGIDLAARHRLIVEPGPDFAVYRVFPVLPLGPRQGGLGIYLGHHPSLRSRQGATRVPGEILGQTIAWEESIDEGVTSRQAIARHGEASVHVFLSADDPAVLAGLVRIAESLRAGVRPVALAPCPDASELPAIEVRADVLALPALQTLLRAESFSSYRRTWDLERVESTHAFLALGAEARAPEAFAYLAVHGTTAGRLYGLAGLYLRDRERFDRIACAVRDSLEETVPVRASCGVQAEPTSSLFEDPRAVRGERHWTPMHWSAALADAPADMRGGGLAWRLAIGPSDGSSIAAHAWETSGEGYVPPLAGSDVRAASMPPFAPAARRVSMAINSYGGVCRTRADGRVACWGMTPATEGRAARMLPPWLTWPSDLAMDLGLGCALDAQGRRSCFALLDPALEARAQACGTSAPTELVMRRFDDGPWRALDVGHDVCGIDHQGALRCFVSSLQYKPEWAELDGAGIGASYGVPIEGEVRGVTEGYLFDAYAWTADGTIWKWNDRERPRSIRRIEGVVEVTAGNDSAWAFARAQDGRVYVRGAPERNGNSIWYGSFVDDSATEWREVEALRGARVSLAGHHGCALLPDGRVQCWGQSSGYLPGTPDEYDRAPLDVPSLRGARSLVLGEWLTCGEMRGGSWRCIGAHQESLTNGAVPAERREASDVRFDAIAAAIR